MPFIKVNRAMAGLFPHWGPSREPEARTYPERVILPVAKGVVPTGNPPVRIFLGTEPAQHRAERVFVWSVRQARDPARQYEIYLMKDLAGFDRSRWTTGFTNYRFAIPHFAQGSGRAIYNDVDQVYLVDPAELFDLDMGDHGFLAISDTESSVMLIDCAQMAQIWSLEDACRLSKKRLLTRAVAVPGLRGTLSPDWNARDAEYEAGRSKLLHYTTLHTQPWRPFPDQFAYQEHPHAELWVSLERGADAAGAHAFTRELPSRRYQQRLSLFRRMRLEGTSAAGNGAAARWQPSSASAWEHREALASLIKSSQARTVLVYGSGMGENLGVPRDQAVRDLLPEDPAWEDLRITVYDPILKSFSEPPEEKFDGVVCLEVLEQTPEEDIPWVIDELFGYATRFVYALVACYGRKTRLPNGEHTHCTVRRSDWWKARFDAAAGRYPVIHWELAAEQRSLRGTHLWWELGGRYVGREQPMVWVLAEDRAGNNSQSLGLAEALGWPYELKHVQFTVLARLPNRLLGASRLGILSGRSAALTPPWPDLLIATGRRLAPVARWVRKHSRGRTRLVHLGRKGGHVADHFDLVVTCKHFHLPPHPRRIETIAPLNPVIRDRLSQVAERWLNLFGQAPRPHIVLLVGGHSPLCRLDPETARRLGEDVSAFAQAAGGTVHAVTSRRTGIKATEALRRGLGESSCVCPWQPGQSENPYWGYLATADVIVVTGESESMLAETAACGKPVYIYALPARLSGLGNRLREWVLARAHARPANNRGTVRPQQGLEYLCAWLLASGIVLPPRDLTALHQALLRLGIARPFGEPLRTGARPVLNETGGVARRVRALLGVRDGNQAGVLTSAAESVTTTVCK